MPEFSVKVRVTKILEKPMQIFAGSEEEANRRAGEIVSRWKDVEEAEGFDATRVTW